MASPISLELRAVYRNVDSTKTFRHGPEEFRASSKTTTQERTKYLSALRSSVIKLQNEVNVFLTQKMEEDKAARSPAENMTPSKSEANRETEDEQLYDADSVEDGG